MPNRPLRTGGRGRFEGGVRGLQDCSIRISLETHMDQWLPSLSESSGLHRHSYMECSSLNTALTVPVSSSGSVPGPPCIPEVTQWARRDRLMSRGKNCRETIFVSHFQDDGKGGLGLGSRFSRELQRGKRKHDPFFGSLKNRPLPAPPKSPPPSKPPPEPVDHGPPKPPPSLRTWFLQTVAGGQGDYQVFGEQGLLQQRSGDEGVLGYAEGGGVRGSAGGGKGFWRVWGG